MAATETKHLNYIDGRFVEAEGGKTLEVRNPATGAVVADAPDSSVQDACLAIEAAKRAQPAWARLTAAERATCLHKVAAGLRRDADRLSRLMSAEQGKPVAQALGETYGTADYFDYTAEWARRIEGEVIQSDRPHEFMFLDRQPIGVVTGIVPWNFPLALMARKVAPALITGNAIVIKPSELTPLSTLAVGQIFAESGVPSGVVNLICGYGQTVGEELARNTDVGMVSVTGSVRTGIRVMQLAAPNLTKVGLELGGNAPAIVMPDANLDQAVTLIKKLRIANTGQVCGAPDRVYVHHRIADEFTDKFAKAMSEARYGNALVDGDVDLGPLINAAQLARVEKLVDETAAAGATILTGGSRAADRPEGYFYPATVLADCRQDMPAVKAEKFAPVMPIVVVNDFDEAIAYANDSDYGLASSIFTQDVNLIMRAVHELHCGETYVNQENQEILQGFHAGWRKSGIGGDDGKHGVLEFTNTHVVYLNYDPTTNPA